MLGLFKKSVDKQTTEAKTQSGNNGMNNLKVKNFGGMSGKQIQDALASNGPKMSLVSQEVSASAQRAILEVAKEKPGIKVTQSDKLFEEIATMFAEAEDKSAVEIIKNHIKDNKGQVDKRYWFMLLDIYQVGNQKVEFEKTALIFAKQFNCSPPSWHLEEEAEGKTSITGKNLLILSKLTIDEKDKLKEFLTHAKEEKFCRIDITKLKFEDSSLEGFQLLLSTMYELRKSKVLSLLLGENNLLNFTKQYIKGLNQNYNPEILNTVFVNNSSLFWLLYLEVLQWKNRLEEFEDLAIGYAVEFELSAPGWDENGVMKVESSIIQQQISEEVEDNHKIPNVKTIHKKTIVKPSFS